MRKWKRRLPAFAVAAALGLSLSACSNSDKPLASIAATPTTTTTTGSTNTTLKVTTKPAVDSTTPNQRNARNNVDLINCAATAKGWSAGGVVTNPSSQAVTYDISVNFNSTGSSPLAERVDLGPDSGREDKALGGQRHLQCTDSRALRAAGRDHELGEATWPTRTCRSVDLSFRLRVARPAARA